MKERDVTTIGAFLALLSSVFITGIAICFVESLLSTLSFGVGAGDSGTLSRDHGSDTKFAAIAVGFLITAGTILTPIYAKVLRKWFPLNSDDNRVLNMSNLIVSAMILIVLCAWFRKLKSTLAMLIPPKANAN
jgi:hypothetical protein